MTSCQPPHAPRMSHPPELTAFLHRIGRNIAAQRHQLGWTQEALAGALGISIKNAQRLESGKPDLRASSLLKLANILGVSVVQLVDNALPAESPPAPRTSGPLAGLARLGWTLFRSQQPGAIPVLDLGLRASVPQGQRVDTLPRQVGWARGPGATPQPDGYFLAKVQGASMAPEIPSGAWCLFQRPVSDVRLRAIVLARPLGDDDSGGAYLLKRLAGAEETLDGVIITLRSTAPGHIDIVVTVERPEEVLLAELVRVLEPA